MVRRFSGRCLSVLLALSLGLVGCGGSSSSSGGGPSGSGVDGGSGLGGPNSYGPGTGTPGLFAPPSGSPSPTASPTTPPPIYDPDTDAALLSISVSPASLSLHPSQTQQLTVIGHLDDGTTATLVSSSEVSITFSTVSTSVASVGTSGLVTAISIGTETVSVNVAVGSQTFPSSVLVTVLPPVMNLIFDPEFDIVLDSFAWMTFVDVPVTAGLENFPYIERRSSFDPVALPIQEGDDFLYIEAPLNSRGGVSQFVTLPSLSTGEYIELRFEAFARTAAGTVTVEVVGSSTLTQTFAPTPFYDASGVPTGATGPTNFNMSLSILAGQTVEIRFLTSTPVAPGTFGDTGVGIDSLLLIVDDNVLGG